MRLDVAEIGQDGIGHPPRGERPGGDRAGEAPPSIGPEYPVAQYGREDPPPLLHRLLREADPLRHGHTTPPTFSRVAGERPQIPEQRRGSPRRFQKIVSTRGAVSLYQGTAPGSSGHGAARTGVP